MVSNQSGRKSYFELSEHNSIQVIVFFVVILIFAIIIFNIIIVGLEGFFRDFLDGRVFHSGEILGKSLEYPDPKSRTDWLFSWAVDIYVNTPSEGRYWFNPILAVFVPVSLLSIACGVSVSALLPRSIGYMNQKIQREITNFLDKILISRDGFYSEEYHDELADEIINADIRDLYDYEEIWNINVEELKILQKALKWYNGSLLYKIIHVRDGLGIYMHSYFTVKYNNAVLGFVYIGAAVLIIIIGLRGLKFIPPTQPSLVLFALGLEFSLLITYATTLMYAKQDEETEHEHSRSASGNSTSLLGTNNLSSAKEIESLLRVFIKKSNKD